MKTKFLLISLILLMVAFASCELVPVDASDKAELESITVNINGNDYKIELKEMTVAEIEADTKTTGTGSDANEIKTVYILTVKGHVSPPRILDKSQKLNIAYQGQIPSYITVESIKVSENARSTVTDGLRHTFSSTRSTNMPIQITSESGLASKLFNLLFINADKALKSAGFLVDGKLVSADIDLERRLILLPKPYGSYLGDVIVGNIETENKETTTSVSEGDNINVDGEGTKVIVTSQDGSEEEYTVRTASYVDIPDPQFKAYLRIVVPTAFISNNPLYKGKMDTEDESVKALQEIVANNQGIFNVEGIEYFPNLEKIELNDNQISDIDLSKNLKLTTLKISGNLLSSLDLTANSQLVNLDCSANSINSLNISKNTKLNILRASENNLVTLSLVKNVDLTSINVALNKLTEIDFSKNLDLVAVNITSNKIISLNLSKQPDLQELLLSNNALTSVDIRRMTSKNSWNVVIDASPVSNPLRELYIHTSLKDILEFYETKQAMGSDIKIVTYDDSGLRVCGDYNPNTAEGGGSCNDQ